MRAKLSESQEDYLKWIYLLAETEGAVSTQDLADRLAVKPASVTGMLKKLGDLGLVTHVKYRGVTLTEPGTRIALEILRHHRLLESYLAEVMGYSWDEIHAEAEKLEHHISEKLEARISEMLGHPTHDPHGDPIPSVDLKVPEGPPTRALIHLPNGATGTLQRVRTQDPDVLMLLTKLDLTLGARIHRVGAGTDDLKIEVGGTRFALPNAVARLLEVVV